MTVGTFTHPHFKRIIKNVEIGNKIPKFQKELLCPEPHAYLPKDYTKLGKIWGHSQSGGENYTDA